MSGFLKTWLKKLYSKEQLVPEIDWSKYESPPEGKAQSENELDWSAYEKPPEAPAPETKGFGGIASDIGSLAQEAPGQAVEMLSQFLQQVPGAAGQIQEHPLSGTGRALGKLGSGAVSTLKGAWNLPFELNQYLAKKDLPVPVLNQLLKSTSPLAKKLMIGDTGVDKAIFGEQQPVDPIFEGIGSVFPLGVGAKGATMLSKAARGSGIGAAHDQNPLAMALMSVAPEVTGKAVSKPLRPVMKKRELNKLEDPLDSKGEELGISTDKLNELKESLHEEFGKDSPKQFQRDIKLSTDKLKELEPLTKIPEEDLSKRLPPGTGEDLIPQATKQFEEAKAPIQTLLKEGATHDVEAAKHIKKVMDEDKRRLGEEYDKKREELTDQNIKLSNSREASEIMSELKKVISESSEGVRSPEALNLVKELDEVGKEKNIPANKFMDAYRTVRKLASKARKAARERDLTQEEYAKRSETVDKLEAKEHEMQDVLEKGVGKDHVEDIKKINKKWAKHVASLYKNPIARDVHSKGRIDKADIIKELRGAGPGQEKLNQMVSENPDLLHSILGQQFADKPEKLLKTTEQQERYIKQSPQLQEMIKELSKSLKNVEKSKVKKAVMDAERERVQKAFQEDFSRQKARKDALEEHKKLTEEVDKKERALKQLEKTIKEHKGTEKEFKELENRKKELDKDINKSKSKLKKVTSALLKLAGVKYGISKLF